MTRLFNFLCRFYSLKAFSRILHRRSDASSTLPCFRRSKISRTVIPYLISNRNDRAEVHRRIDAGARIGLRTTGQASGLYPIEGLAIHAEVDTRLGLIGIERGIAREYRGFSKCGQAPIA